MSNKIYNICAFISRQLLPALAALIVAFGDTWGIPYAAQISASVAAIAAFINTLLAEESKKYFEDK